MDQNDIAHLTVHGLDLLQHGWCEQTGEVVSLPMCCAVQMCFTIVFDWCRAGGHCVVLRTSGDAAHCITELVTELRIFAKIPRRN